MSLSELVVTYPLVLVLFVAVRKYIIMLIQYVGVTCGGHVHLHVWACQCVCTMCLS